MDIHSHTTGDCWLKFQAGRSQAPLHSWVLPLARRLCSLCWGCAGRYLAGCGSSGNVPALTTLWSCCCPGWDNNPDRAKTNLVGGGHGGEGVGQAVRGAGGTGGGRHTCRPPAPRPTLNLCYPRPPYLPPLHKSQKINHRGRFSPEFRAEHKVRRGVAGGQQQGGWGRWARVHLGRPSMGGSHSMHHEGYALPHAGVQATPCLEHGCPTDSPSVLSPDSQTSPEFIPWTAGVVPRRPGAAARGTSRRSRRTV